jgi:hypothetical protein
MARGRRRQARRGSIDRRGGERAFFGGLFMNKYIEGLPHLARVLDLSSGGMMVRKLLEPETAPKFFAIELGIPWTDERLWIWARCVREWSDRQALRFFGMGASDEARLAEIVREVRAGT